MTDLQNRLVALRDIRYVGTATAYNTLIAAQASRNAPLMVLATAPLSGTAGRTPYNYPVGTLIYFAPNSATPVTRPFVIPYRFEVAVGASGSVLPAGTHSIVVSAKLTEGDVILKYSKTILLSDLNSTTDVWMIDSGNPQNYDPPRDFTIALAYNSSRTLTYAWDNQVQGSSFSEQSIKAIGVSQ